MASPIDSIIDNVSEAASSVGSFVDETLGTTMFSGEETPAAEAVYSDDSDYDEEPVVKKSTGGAAYDGSEEEPVVEYAEYNESDVESEMTDDSDDDYDFSKFDDEKVNMTVEQYHPNLKQEKYEDVLGLSKVVMNESGNVVDNIHNTLPFLTKFERAKVLGLRAKQLGNGAEPFIEVPSNVIENYVIAEMELQAKVLPFIISRPLPNGRKEFWKLKDLDLIDY